MMRTKKMTRSSKRESDKLYKLYLLFIMTLLSTLYKTPGSVTHLASGDFLGSGLDQFVLVRGSIVLELWSFEAGF